MSYGWYSDGVKRRNASSESELARVIRVLHRVRDYCDSGHPRYAAWSRRAVARYLGVSDRSVRRWLSGEDVPKRRYFALLCALVENPNKLTQSPYS